MTWTRPTVFAFILAAGVAAGPEPAISAPRHTCERVADDLIEVDGLLDDWKGGRGRRLGSGNDLSMKLGCAYDDQRLFVVVDIRDERILRTKRARARSEDHLDIRLGSGKGLRVRVFPGNDKLDAVITVGGKRPPPWAAVADSLQRRGWSMELSVPLSRIPGWSRSAHGVAARLAYHDADQAAARRIEEVKTFDGLFEFSDAAALMRSFSRATGLKRADIRFDRMADLDGDGKAERVVAGKSVIGVLGDGFTYMNLPVQRAADVIRLEVADLAGDGRAALIVQYRQHGGGGSRDVVGVWYVSGKGAFDRVLAFEVRKEMGSGLLASDWKLVPRGKLRKGKRQRRGRDILVEAGEARGWDEDNYEEIPASDVQPILRPWEDQTSAVYWFQDGRAHGGEPKRGR